MKREPMPICSTNLSGHAAAVPLIGSLDAVDRESLAGRLPAGALDDAGHPFWDSRRREWEMNRDHWLYLHELLWETVANAVPSGYWFGINDDQWGYWPETL